MWWRGKFNFFIILLIFFSCSKEKRYEDFNEEDFYEVQGIITNVYQTPSVFDSPYNKSMNYSYSVNDSVFLNGSEREFYKAWVVGDPIVVLVHKNDSKINFYARNGFLDNVTEEQFRQLNLILT
ncbi:hypothetical protein P8625_08335 [Tenacibaculum tangerinum]|uniref:Uncharacterized protein n=1 Tax=Tenacibaculum tangerinum TaxID=3038772 RepID=A0ABY8L1R2_9FLAO|nr:hypothetical protein [Tenacibaculum tangerinum]WGH74128.1 hypothetical protein P8625_08335 [Tenacibaculum tangerinum]